MFIGPLLPWNNTYPLDNNGNLGCKSDIQCFPSLPTPQELEKCDANHYIILFRDAGCQFRALYCNQLNTEEIYNLTGMGPKNITKKMIDKLYKYSSDRQQFNLIPAKTMSVSVGALSHDP